MGSEGMFLGVRSIRRSSLPGRCQGLSYPAYSGKCAWVLPLDVCQAYMLLESCPRPLTGGGSLATASWCTYPSVRIPRLFDPQTGHTGPCAREALASSLCSTIRPSTVFLPADLPQNGVLPVPCAQYQFEGAIVALSFKPSYVFLPR
jgi:hypothetical protein